jgi:hypothetical protein
MVAVVEANAHNIAVTTHGWNLDHTVEWQPGLTLLGLSEPAIRIIEE